MIALYDSFFHNLESFGKSEMKSLQLMEPVKDITDDVTSSYNMLSAMGKNIAMALTESKLKHAAHETALTMSLSENMYEVAKQTSVYVKNVSKTLQTLQNRTKEKNTRLYNASSQTFLGSKFNTFLLNVSNLQMVWKSIDTNYTITKHSNVQDTYNELLKLKKCVHDWNLQQSLNETSEVKVCASMLSLDDRMKARAQLLEVQKEIEHVLKNAHHSQISEKLKVLHVQESELTFKIDGCNATPTFIMTNDNKEMKKENIEKVEEHLQKLIDEGDSFIIETYKLKEAIDKQTKQEFMEDYKAVRENMKKFIHESKKKVNDYFEKSVQLQTAFSQECMDWEKTMLGNLKYINAVERFKVQKCYSKVLEMYESRKLAKDFEIMSSNEAKLKSLTYK